MKRYAEQLETGGMTEKEKCMILTTCLKGSRKTTYDNVFKAKKTATMYLTVTDKNVALPKM